MAYEGFKDLPRRTSPDKVLHNKAFDIVKNPKHDGYLGNLTSMFYLLPVVPLKVKLYQITN